MFKMTALLGLLSLLLTATTAMAVTKTCVSDPLENEHNTYAQRFRLFDHEKDQFLIMDKYVAALRCTAKPQLQILAYGEDNKGRSVPTSYDVHPCGETRKAIAFKGPYLFLIDGYEDHDNLARTPKVARYTCQ